MGLRTEEKQASASQPGKKSANCHKLPLSIALIFIVCLASSGRKKRTTQQDG
jgi:hypothetical protein